MIYMDLYKTILRFSLFVHLFCRLQAVMCIISTIMESCPSTSSFYSTAAAKTQHNGMNNIIRLFLKKGLVNDLARVPHSLDLSRYIITLYSFESFCNFDNVRLVGACVIKCDL